MADTAVRLKWTSSDKRFFFVAEVKKLFCIGERLPRVQGQACGCEYCQTVGKTGQHERQHFMTAWSGRTYSRTTPHNTKHTYPTAIMKHQQVWMLNFVNFVPQEGLTCFPLHDNTGLYSSVHTTEAIHKFWMESVAASNLQSWPRTIRLSPIWSFEEKPARIRQWWIARIRQWWSTADRSPPVTVDEGQQLVSGGNMSIL